MILRCRGDLLWVYEGLTQYLGDVLAARSGLETPEQYREYLANSAATLDARPGRSWRNLQDTATAAQVLYSTSNQWDNWRRGVDYYPEGELVWLEIDTILRKQTANKKSLNDFCAMFFSIGGDTLPKVMPYTLEDVIAALNTIVPYDWGQLLKARLTAKVPHAPLTGIENSGYKLVYTDQPNPYMEASASAAGESNQWFSLGVRISNDGKVEDVLLGSPAEKAGLGPSMQVVAVNRRQYASGLLTDAIVEAKNSTAPIELIVSNTGYYKILNLSYHDGLRYPHLERVSSMPDRLSEIIAPMVGAKH